MRANIFSLLFIMSLLSTPFTQPLYSQGNLEFQLVPLKGGLFPGTNMTVLLNFVVKDTSSVYSLPSFQYLAISNSSYFNYSTIWIKQSSAWVCIDRQLGLCDFAELRVFDRPANHIFLGELFVHPGVFNRSTQATVHIRGGLKRGYYGSNSVQNYYLDTIESFVVNRTFSEVIGYKFMNWVMYGPPKVEYLHIAPFVATFLFYICAMILCIVFSSKQPLKSRGLIPLAMNSFLIIDLLAGMIREWGFTLEISIAYSCYYYIPLGANLLVCAVLVYFFGLLRFVTLTHLNMRKQLFYTKYSKVSGDISIPNRFRLLKWFGTWWGQCLQIILVYVTCATANLVFLAPSGCKGVASDILHVILYGSVVAMLVFVEMYDFILLIVSIRSKCSISEIWKKLYHDDTYHFRTEFLFGFCLIGLPSAGVLLLAFVLEQALPDMTSVNSYFYASTNSITCVACWWLGCGYVLLVTMINTFTHRSKKKGQTGKNLMNELMADPILAGFFEDFVHAEFSPENLYCWKDIMEFRQNPSIQVAHEIYLKYLCQSNSELEINVPMSICLEVKKRIDSSSDGMINTLSEAIFDAVFNDVCQNLADTYSRFIFTADFLKYTTMAEMVRQGLANQ
jgi:hypothetical protein